MDTSQVLFICGGMFEGLDEIVAQRVGRKVMGFTTEARDFGEKEKSKLLELATTDDLLKFGLIPEFIGRLPVLCALSHLDQEALVRILVEPRNALVRQYKRFFELEGARVDFTDEALRTVAELAIEKDTGARGLRSIMETVMLDIMYELPSQKEKRHFTITPDVILGRAAPARKDLPQAGAAAAQEILPAARSSRRERRKRESA
jgi:ATP-dependent Clp protease ATP-binding subunit ClpX